MSDPDLWTLTLEIAVLAALVGGGGYLWARHLAPKFDREYGSHGTPGE